MRRWGPPQEPPKPEIVPIPKEVVRWKCIDCPKAADLIYKGSTFCEGCLTKMRSVYGL